MSTVEDLLDAARENAAAAKHLAALRGKETARASLDHALAAKALADAAGSLYDRKLVEEGERP